MEAHGIEVHYSSSAHDVWYPSLTMNPSNKMGFVNLFVYLFLCGSLGLRINTS